MAKDKAEIGHNISGLKDDAKQAIDKINTLKSERQSINEQIGAIRANMESKGIPKPALDMAMRYLGWEPEKREGFDLAYAIVREAGGLPVAPDLVDMMAENKKRDVDAQKNVVELAKKS